MLGRALPLVLTTLVPSLYSVAGITFAIPKTWAAALALILGANSATNLSLLGFNVLLLAVAGTLASHSVYRLGRRDQEAHESDPAVHLRTAEALAITIEARNHATSNRLQRLQAFSSEVARHLSLPADEQEALRTAALLHDIGKLAVPEHILRKFGRLTRHEVEKIKTHPVAGAEILKHLDLPAPVVKIVRSHHERWDGSGYPDRLKGKSIPLGARILAAVDYMDTLAFNPHNHKSIPLHQAMERVAERSGKTFDPEVVSALEKCSAGFEKLSWAQSESLDGLLREDPVYPASGGTGFLEAVAAARHENQTLFEMFQEMGTSLKLDEMFSAFSARLKQLVPYNTIAAYSVSEGHLSPAYVTGQDFPLFAALRIQAGEGVSGHVAKTRKPVVNGAVLQETSGHTTLRSAIAVPLEGQHGIVGVLTLYHTGETPYTSDHLRVLLTVSSKLASSMENAVAFQKAQDLATTDYLTELPNARSLFQILDREVARCKRLKTSVTVMVCDLDGFKHVNDRFGHLEGNRILRMFAKNLESSCRPYDYVARMGGDEFVIVAPGLSLAAAQASGMRLAEVARDSGRAVCGEDLLSLSVGYAVYPEDGTDAEKLLAEADRRMYQEKQRHHLAHEAYVMLPNDADADLTRLVQ